MRFKFLSPKVPALQLLLLLFFSLVLCSCLPKQDISVPGSGTGTSAPYTGNVTLKQANQLYQSGNAAEAERLGNLLADAPGASADDISGALELVSKSALANNRAQDSYTALERIRSVKPDADKDESWNALWGETLKKLPANQADAIARQTEADASRPWQVRSESSLYLLEENFRGSTAKKQLPGFEKVYKAAPSDSYKKQLEKRMYSLLNYSDGATLNQLEQSVSDVNDKTYPYALISLESARRLYLEPVNQGLAKEKVAFLRDGSLLKNKDIFKNWTKVDSPVLTHSGIKASALVLVLPMQDPYGNISDKIVRGAQAACDRISASGHKLQLKVIDTDSEGWLNELASLPKDMFIVGGPLRASDYTAIKEAGLLPGRILFGFLPRLDDGDEGHLAWRIFPTRDDQVKALLNFATSMGIQNYAALLPDEDFGHDMFGRYSRQIEAAGLTLVQDDTYPVEEYKAWNGKVGSFLKTHKKSEYAPATKFQALFLPDTWRNAYLMIPNFFYYRENRLLIMGPNLWEQALSVNQNQDGRIFNMTIFPGSWNPGTVTPAGMAVRSAASQKRGGKADFWTALGFDFVSMVAAVPLQQGMSARDVNSALLRLPEIAWSGAPFTWNSFGEGSQQMFIFTPTDTGYELAKPERIRQLLRRYWRLD